MRNTPEGRDFVREAKDQGVKAAVTQRDAPFNDCSQAPKNRQPRKKFELGLQLPATARPFAGQSPSAGIGAQLFSPAGRDGSAPLYNLPCSLSLKAG